MLDMGQWTKEQRDIARHEFEIYKQRIRPLINGGRLYHVSERPDGVHFDGMQYVDPGSGQGVVFAFRGTTGESRHVFKLKGLEPDAEYQLSFEDYGEPVRRVRGSDLLSTGIEVVLPETESSQLVYLSR